LQQRDATAREREQYRQQLASTSQDKARMEGRMEELQSQAQLTAAQIKETQDQLRQAQEKLAALKPPATQPSTLAERIAGLMLAN